MGDVSMTMHTENIPQIFAWVAGIIVFEIIWAILWIYL